jgi:hypothetical protein
MSFYARSLSNLFLLVSMDKVNQHQIFRSRKNGRPNFLLEDLLSEDLLNYSFVEKFNKKAAISK